MVTVWRGGSLAGEHGCVAEMHSACAMQHMDYAGAAGLGLCLGLLEHSTDRWAVQLQLRGVGREVQCGVHLLAISATVPWSMMMEDICCSRRSTEIIKALCE